MPEAPPVRLEVREDRDTIHEVRFEEAWPLSRTRWTDLYLRADGRLTDEPAGEAGAVSFDTRSGRASFLWDFPEDTEVTGPMALRLFVEAREAEDVYLFVGVQKLRGGRMVPFEGSFGYGFDRVTTGWLKASLRKLDPDQSTPWRPVHAYDEAQPLKPGEVVPMDIALLPSATLFRGGRAAAARRAGALVLDPEPALWPVSDRLRARASGVLRAPLRRRVRRAA
jgi:putative CocE/NonD family hydrolase